MFATALAEPWIQESRGVLRYFIYFSAEVASVWGGFYDHLKLSGINVLLRESLFPSGKNSGQSVSLQDIPAELPQNETMKDCLRRTQK